MDNPMYNRLIYENKLEELAEICYFRITDLITYKYLNKYLLEYLLEKNIHNNRMDNYAIGDSLWISLYLKYNIVDSLVNSHLKELLILNNGELLLDKVLKVLNNEQRRELYSNFKRENYWLYMHNESFLIKTFAKYNIKIPGIFINVPTISDKNIPVGDKFSKLLEDFREVYYDLDNDSLGIVINELKRKVKIDRARTINDIKLLIDYKKNHKSFKLVAKNKTIEDNESIGSFSSHDSELIIGKHRNGSTGVINLLFKRDMSTFLNFTAEEERSNNEE